MKAIKRITQLPDWEWGEQSAKEIALTGQELLDQTDVIYQIGEVVIVGLVYYSLVQPPWLWFTLARNVSLGDLLDFRRLMHRIPKGTLTAVEAGAEKAERFAKLYGFVEIGEERKHEGIVYNLYRKS